MDTKNLKTRAILSVSLIVAFSVLSFVVLSVIISGNLWHSKIINISGRQRMLSQRIALLSLELTDTGSVAPRSEIRDKLKQSIESFSSRHNELIRGIDLHKSGHNRRIIRGIYFSKPQLLDQKAKTYLKEAKLILEEKGVIRTDNIHLKTILTAAPEILVSLDKVVALNQEMSEKDILNLRRTNLLAMTLIIIITAMTGIFIFRPSIMQIEKDARDLEKLNEHFKKLSTIDALTRVANRRSFDELYIREWRRAIRERTTISIIILDIDFFKNYNDALGHQAGDECLKSIANLMKDTFTRPVDIVARYGGEEFIVVLPETPLNSAFNMADEIRRNVEKLHIVHPNSPISTVVTISAGVAANSFESSSHKNLITAADKALYLAKNNGRNRVESGG